MHRRFPFSLSALVPLAIAVVALSGCEQKASTPPPVAAPAEKVAPHGGVPVAAPPAAPAAAPADAKTVGFELTNPSPVGALQIDIQYKSDGRFVGDADAVACETKVEGALSSYNHITGEKMLRAAFVAVKGFTGPVRFSECKFQGNPKPEDFTITVKDSSSPDLQPVDPPVAVKVVVN